MYTPHTIRRFKCCRRARDAGQPALWLPRSRYADEFRRALLLGCYAYAQDADMHIAMVLISAAAVYISTATFEGFTLSTPLAPPRYFSAFRARHAFINI